MSRIEIIFLSIVFGAIMIALKLTVGPWFVKTYGWPGVLSAIAVFMLIGWLIERHDSKQRGNDI